MRTPVEEAPSIPLLSDVEQMRIREQMNRLLETTHFNHSRRYPALLRFLIEETLAGRAEFLKERFLGVQVFDRPADYDTASDPIVRVTIAEIRKRIAQYYHDEAHDSELRIELLPGSYVPEFRTSREAQAVVQPEPTGGFEPVGLLPMLPVADAEPHVAASSTSGPVQRRTLVYSVSALALLLLVCLPVYRWLRPAPIEALWAPFVRPGTEILFCLPTNVGQQPDAIVPLPDSAASRSGESGANLPVQGSDPGHTTFLQFEALGENVVLSDVLATLKIASLLTAHHRDSRLKLNVATTLDDLRQGPSVVIGGLDNQWTLRAIAGLRYRFSGNGRQGFWISDAQNPADRRWSLDLQRDYGAVTRDYAIVARLHNEQTGQPQMIVAGIGMSGTAAAGEFLTNPAQIDELSRRIGPALRDRDFEVVLGTDVVNGMAGPPMILATSVR